MITSSVDGESRSIYKSVYIIKGYNKEYFIPTSVSAMDWSTIHPLDDVQLLKMICILPFWFDWGYWTVVCILVMQRSGVLLVLSNKALIIKKRTPFF
jgi:hypothetical protein